jgi:hypothetical protein
LGLLGLLRVELLTEQIQKKLVGTLKIISRSFDRAALFLVTIRWGCFEGLSKQRYLRQPLHKQKLKKIISSSISSLSMNLLMMKEAQKPWHLLDKQQLFIFIHLNLLRRIKYI